MKETGCAVGGGHSGQRYRFRPAGSPVQDGKEIGETGRAGKWTHKINMDMRKTAARNLNLLRLQMNMFVHLAALAVETRTSQDGDLFAHVWPTKSRGNQAAGCPDPWMRNVMQGVEGGRAELRRQEGAEFACGHIP
jgi:hypothetical protein